MNGYVSPVVEAAPVLPDPSTTVFGIPLAKQYDDAFVYPTRLLNYFYPADGWNPAAGTGTLDIIITTRSSGVSNPSPFPDPIPNPNTNPITDTWGAGATGAEQLLVKDLLDYLLTFFKTTVPQFTFDQNETGGNPALTVSAKVEIIDGPGGAVLHTWAMDDLFQAGDGSYDPANPATAAGEIIIPDVMDTCPGDTCTFKNNVGSGQFDYSVLVPTMDLTPWADADNLFKVTWEFGDVDDGGEEITLTGRFYSNDVPEPGIAGLFGLAGIGMLAAWRRRRI